MLMASLSSLKFGFILVYLFDGSSDYDADVWSELVVFIGQRHLFTSILVVQTELISSFIIYLLTPAHRIVSYHLI